MIWPKVFTDENFSYGATTEENRYSAMEDALAGWAFCHISSNELPKYFGKSMIKIAQFLGVNEAITDKNVKEISERLGFFKPES